MARGDESAVADLLKPDVTTAAVFKSLFKTGRCVLERGNHWVLSLARHVSMSFLSTCGATRFVRPSSGCIVHHVTSDVLPWKVPPGFGIFRTRRWLDRALAE